MDKTTTISEQELSDLLSLKDDVKEAERQVSAASKDYEISQLRLKNYLLTLYRKYSLSDKDQLMLEDGTIKYAPEKLPEEQK